MGLLDRVLAAQAAPQQDVDLSATAAFSDSLRRAAAEKQRILEKDAAKKEREAERIQKAELEEDKRKGKLEKSDFVGNLKAIESEVLSATNPDELDQLRTKGFEKLQEMKQGIQTASGENDIANYLAENLPIIEQKIANKDKKLKRTQELDGVRQSVENAKLGIAGGVEGLFSIGTELDNLEQDMNKSVSDGTLKRPEANQDVKKWFNESLDIWFDKTSQEDGATSLFAGILAAPDKFQAQLGLNETQMLNLQERASDFITKQAKNTFGSATVNAAKSLLPNEKDVVNMTPQEFDKSMRGPRDRVNSLVAAWEESKPLYAAAGMTDEEMLQIGARLAEAVVEVDKQFVQMKAGREYLTGERGYNGANPTQKEAAGKAASVFWNGWTDQISQLRTSVPEFQFDENGKPIKDAKGNPVPNPDFKAAQEQIVGTMSKRVLDSVTNTGELMPAFASGLVEMVNSSDPLSREIAGETVKDLMERRSNPTVSAFQDRMGRRALNDSIMAAKFKETMSWDEAWASVDQIRKSERERKVVTGQGWSVTEIEKNGRAVLLDRIEEEFGIELTEVPPALMQDYILMARLNLADFGGVHGGDLQLADQTAIPQAFQKWGVTNLGPEPRLVKDPIEKVYGEFGIKEFFRDEGKKFGLNRKNTFLSAASDDQFEKPVYFAWRIENGVMLPVLDEDNNWLSYKPSDAVLAGDDPFPEELSAADQESKAFQRSKRQEMRELRAKTEDEIATFDKGSSFVKSMDRQQKKAQAQNDRLDRGEDLGFSNPMNEAIPDMAKGLRELFFTLTDPDIASRENLINLLDIRQKIESKARVDKDPGILSLLGAGVLDVAPSFTPEQATKERARLDKLIEKAREDLREQAQ